MFLSVREFLEAKLREPGGGSIWSAEGSRASNRLTRCPATHNRVLDSRAQPGAIAPHEFGSDDLAKSARTVRSAVGERGSGAEVEESV